jgi:hypothetical protein
MKLENWINDLIFPVVAVYWIEQADDRFGGVNIAIVEYVSIGEFK